MPLPPPGRVAILLCKWNVSKATLGQNDSESARVLDHCNTGLAVVCELLQHAAVVIGQTHDKAQGGPVSTAVAGELQGLAFDGDGGELLHIVRFREHLDDMLMNKSMLHSIRTWHKSAHNNDVGLV